MPSDQPNYVDVSAYVVIKPKWSRHHFDAQDRPILEGAAIDKTTITRPRIMPREGGVVSKVTFRIDANALLPLQPEAVIHIGAGEIELIEVEATDPRLDEVP